MTSTIFKLLALCFLIDIYRKFKETSKIRKPQNEINQFTEIKKEKEEEIKEIDLSLDDEEDDIDNKFPKKKRNKKLIIKYDKKSYQKFYDQFEKELMGNLTEYKIDNEEYPINPTKKWLSKYTFISQMGISMLLFGGSKFKDKIKFIPSLFFETVEKNKWMFVIGNFLFHQWLNNFLSTTGAFEIYYNGNIVYSKLSKRILPKVKDVINSLSLME